VKNEHLPLGVQKKNWKVPDSRKKKKDPETGFEGLFLTYQDNNVTEGEDRSEKFRGSPRQK